MPQALRRSRRCGSNRETWLKTRRRRGSRKRRRGRGVRIDPPFTGRANLFAEHAGVLEVDRAAIDRINMIDEAITFATLEQFKPVVAGEMIATVKIITYAISEGRLAQAEAVARGGEGSGADRALHAVTHRRDLDPDQRAEAHHR